MIESAQTVELIISAVGAAFARPVVPDGRHRCETGIGGDGETPSLIVGEMKVKAVESQQPDYIDHSIQRRWRKEMARRIDHKTPPFSGRLIVDGRRRQGDGRCIRSEISIEKDRLRQRRQRSGEGRSVGVADDDLPGTDTQIVSFPFSRNVFTSYRRFSGTPFRRWRGERDGPDR